ncbi:MAG: NAD(P)/FAD-dependent oxidoreductase [Deltaproteobacteria bacterium]|nr:NAD(P)/FAD-dependent oxidoreductase [Deltaproteobacteria bacterium]
MAYDVIIAGRSFAGLAVAGQLRGKVLLIEPHGIGEQQTSACGTPLAVPERLGLMDSVLQVHRELVLHTRTYTAVVDVSDDPFCTFDYRKFCRGMAAALQADILKARVLGREDSSVVTDRGRFSGEVIVDASGWRSVLASQKRKFRHRRQFMNFGIETVTRRRGEKLCFWFDPGELPRGIAWFFPIGNGSRVGVGNYIADNHLGPPLEDFLKSLGLARAETHGGYFPAGLRQPVEENIFYVGDAAGQCLPLTGEGIRPAIYFGQACGSIIQDFLDGGISLQDALQAYRSFVAEHRKVYQALRLAQRLVANLPPPLGRFLLLLACRDIFLSYIRPHYMSFASARGLRPLWRADRAHGDTIQAIGGAEAA